MLSEPCKSCVSLLCIIGRFDKRGIIEVNEVFLGDNRMTFGYRVPVCE